MTSWSFHLLLYYHQILNVQLYGHRACFRLLRSVKEVCLCVFSVIISAKCNELKMILYK